MNMTSRVMLLFAFRLYATRRFFLFVCEPMQNCASITHSFGGNLVVSIIMFLRVRSCGATALGHRLGSRRFPSAFKHQESLSIQSLQRPIAASHLLVWRLAIRTFSSSPVDLETNTSEAYTIHQRSGVRCVAIVAHVDHGKTTLVSNVASIDDLSLIFLTYNQSPVR
jgi:hypothetical protein